MLETEFEPAVRPARWNRPGWSLRAAVVAALACASGPFARAQIAPDALATAETQLGTAYSTAIRHLRLTGDSAGLLALRLAQRAWLAQRDGTCAYASIQRGFDQLRDASVRDCFAKLTVARVSALGAPPTGTTSVAPETPALAEASRLRAPSDADVPCWTETETRAFFVHRPAPSDVEFMRNFIHSCTFRVAYVYASDSGRVSNVGDVVVTLRDGDRPRYLKITGPVHGWGPMGLDVPSNCVRHCELMSYDSSYAAPIEPLGVLAAVFVGEQSPSVPSTVVQRPMAAGPTASGVTPSALVTAPTSAPWWIALGAILSAALLFTMYQHVALRRRFRRVQPLKRGTQAWSMSAALEESVTLRASNANHVGQSPTSPTANVDHAPVEATDITARASGRLGAIAAAFKGEGRVGLVLSAAFLMLAIYRFSGMFGGGNGYTGEFEGTAKYSLGFFADGGTAKYALEVRAASWGLKGWYSDGSSIQACRGTFRPPASASDYFRVSTSVMCGAATYQDSITFREGVWTVNGVRLHRSPNKF